MITINVKSALVYLVLIALFVLLIYLIVLAKNLVKTVHHLNDITEDASKITGVAAARTADINDIITDVQKAAADISAAVKGHQGILAAGANFAKAAANAVEYVKDRKDKKKDK